jgi:hypothetical protein
MKIIALLFGMVLSCFLSFSQTRKMVAIGSSTTAGLRAIPLDSSWVSRFNYYYKYQLGVLDSTYNLGVSGNSQYSGMPSSYVRAGRPAPNPAKNVTKAISLLRDVIIPDHGVVIVNFPTNGYENYSIEEIITTLQIIYDSATRTGNKCYITTTQPRTSGVFGTSVIKRKLAVIKDSIIRRFGVEHTINFWDGMYNPADTSILAIYSAGDRTHFNNAGHKILFNRVVAKNIFNLPVAAINDYRSNVLNSGNWETAANWQKWNGNAWVPATTPPNSSSGMITILGGDVMNITSNLTIDGNITINHGGTISAGNNTINLKGSWDISEGTFIAGTGTIIFSGSADQEVTGTTQFQNVTIAKTGYLRLNGATTINGTLTLTTGVIVSTSTYPIRFGPSGTFAGGSSASFIEGPVKKNIGAGSAFTFPTGDTMNGQYRPATVFNTDLTDDWTVTYVGDNPTGSTYPPASLNTVNIKKVSMFEFWDIAPANPVNSAGLTLTYNTGSYSPPNIGNVDHLVVAHWDTFNNRWDLPSGGAMFSHAGTNITGTVTVENVDSFSPFSLGSLDEDSPLPVTWSSFVAKRVEKAIVLDWKTIQEWNSDRFEIERSVDGQTFNSVGSKKASGNSHVPQQYQFTDSEVSDHITYYYRIRQIDFDEKFDYSSIVAVVANGKPVHWSIWPNPVGDQHQFNIVALDKSTKSTVSVKITSTHGAVLFSEGGSLSDLTIQVENRLQTLSSGVYVIHLSDGVCKQHFRIVRH